MTRFENLIKGLVIIAGIVALAAPMGSILLLSSRPRGRSSGRGYRFRSGLWVWLTMFGFVATGILFWIPIPISIPQRLIPLVTLPAALFYFGGVGIYLWGLWTMGAQFRVSGLLGAELHKDHELITNGPFAIVRHPMYVGVILAAVGALLIFRTWAMAIFTPMSLVVIGRAKREEKLLEQEFGKVWISYASKIPMWFPRRR